MSSELVLLAARVLVTAFLVILWVSATFEKIFAWKSNQSFFRDHFKKTFLRPFIDPLLLMLTFMMACSGLVCTVGLVQLLITGGTALATIGAFLSGLTLLSLFFGMRLVNDPSAGSLSGYFLVTLAALVLLRH